jgi:tRNA-splicing endonuclease subunit Sen15, fungi type
VNSKWGNKEQSSEPALRNMLCTAFLLSVDIKVQASASFQPPRQFFGDTASIDLSMNIAKGPVVTAAPPAAPEASSYSRRLDRDLSDIVCNNLENQQDWTELRVHDDGNNGEDASKKYPRTLLSGLPPRRMYIHPDEQIAVMRAERALGTGERIPQPPEYEWVLPVHLGETPTVGDFSAIFDSIDALPRPNGADKGGDAASAPTPTPAADDDWKAWRGSRRAKRLLLAVVQDDSSVVYYFMHDGIVKPRQN